MANACGGPGKIIFGFGRPLSGRSSFGGSAGGTSGSSAPAVVVFRADGSNAGTGGARAGNPDLVASVITWTS